MPILNTLDYLETVAREGSIRKAAESLAITATALNRRILALEAEIGTPLFERLPSGVRLNAAGEIFLHHIRNQGSDLRRVLAQIADLSGLRRGQVRLSVCPEMQHGFLIHAIAEYRARYPEVHFALSEDTPEQALERLETFKADIALSFEALPPVRVHPITSIPQYIEVAMHHSHPLAAQSCIRLHECRDYPVILPADGALRTCIDVGLMQHQIAITPIIICNQTASMYEYLKHEQALGFHFALARPALPDMRSIPLHAKDVGQTHLKLYTIKGRILPVPAAKFLDQLLEIGEDKEAHYSTSSSQLFRSSVR